MTKARDLANASTALSAVSATELAFVDGVTSAIQTQLDARATLTGTQTLTNKTLTSPVLTTPTISTVNAKGDLLVGTADNTVDRLAVGSDGETLVADSSTSTGLRWQGDYAAGKNKIINGNFSINQRNFTSATTTGTFLFDRWLTTLGGDGTNTVTPQTFTPGTAPVAGYESINFLRWVTSGQTTSASNSLLVQRIEDVRTFAGQTVTVSFWAKAATGTPSIAVELQQSFGTGGSATVFGIGSAKTAITTSWARYSVTASVPSISGKTIGTDNRLGLNLWFSGGSDFNARTASLGLQSNTFDVWGVQVEAGSVATAFQTATGTIQGELAACQRYYFRSISTATNALLSSYGINNSTTLAFIPVQLPTSMRTKPASVDYANIELSDFIGEFAISALVIDAGSTPNIGLVQVTSTGLTQFRPNAIRNDANAAGYIAFSAEL